MKFKTVYSVLFFFSALLWACTETDGEIGVISGNDTPPVGALPSANFTLNNLSDEPYAEDAIKLVANDEDAPFYTLELMADGTYLLSTRPCYYSGYSVRVTKNGEGKFSISKSRGTDAVLTRGTTDENGTVTFDDGSEYGKFTKLGDKQYRLGNGVEVDLMNATGSDGSIAYKDMNNRTSHVYVSVSEPKVDDGTRSLCRTWDYNSFEMWIYYNGLYIIHGKQTVNSDGEVETYIKAIGGDLVETDEYLAKVPYKVVFTSAGTYLCFYPDGEVHTSQWAWDDEAQGTLYYYRDYNYSEWDGNVTIRFAGSQMRMYEDYTETEEDEGEVASVRLVIVNTLTAAE